MPRPKARLKGKQVRDLCELVTVSRERMSIAGRQVTDPKGLGRRSCVRIGKPGNLPSVGTGIHFQNHEKLVVPVHGLSVL